MMLLVGIQMYAQDLQILSERSIMGTARYVGMAGAMTAVGGDASAAADNPAGLGVYRRMETSITLGDQIYLTRPSGDKRWNMTNGFNIQQASVVFCFPSGGNVLANNVMVSLQRRNSLHQYTRLTAGAATTTLADVVALKTDGLKPSALTPSGRWDDTEVGWLSCLGYDTYLVDPLGDADNSWVTFLQDGETAATELVVETAGSSNDYGLTWGMNIRNRVYLGAAINMSSMTYRQTEMLREDYALGGYTRNYSSLTISGIGVNGNFGVLIHPVRALRLGLAVQTPTLTNLTIQNSGEMTVARDSVVKAQTPLNTSVLRNERMPWHLTTGLACQLGHGLISLQYDLSHSKNLLPWHSLRVGAEMVVAGRVFLNAGYAYESSFKKNIPVVERAYNSVRTDTNYRYILSKQYASLGLGYHGAWGTAHLAYQVSWRNMRWAEHELAPLAGVDGLMHNIVLTLNWHSRALVE